MKKQKDEFLDTGITLVGTSTMVGSVPNLSGTAGEANIKTDFSKGISNTGRALPVMGKVKGVSMVLKPIKKLTFNKGVKL